MPVLLRRRKLGRTSCREIARFSKSGFQVVRNDARVPAPKGRDYAFRWGCTSDVPEGYVVLNKAEAIHRVSDKSGFRKVLTENNLSPRTWFSTEQAWNSGHRDFVVRPRVHAQGRHIYRCRTMAELVEAVRRCGPGFYISEFIDKTAEYRVFVCQGRAVWVANKIPGNPGDLAWNVARGGRFENVRWDEWPLKVIKTAIAAHKLSGLDYSGVDVMIDGNGSVYVLEINSAPSQTSPYRQECVAKAFDYLIQKGKDEIPLIEARGGYKKFIHPGVCNQAQVK